MPRHTIPAKTRFFLAVEGESERSFVAWLNKLPQIGCSAHLDPHDLRGGGFRGMLEQAVFIHDRNARHHGHYRKKFMLVDSDRANHTENPDWSEAQLKKTALEHGFTLCLQKPNLEGVLLRMAPGMENHRCSDPSTVEKHLKQHWPTYKKGASAMELARHFTFEDLLRAARNDADLGLLLSTIGLQIH